MPDSPRRILFATPTLGRDGGVATHVVASADTLLRSGYEVTIAAERVETDAPDGADVVQIPRLGVARPPAEAIGALAKAAAERGVHLVHLHDVAPEPAVRTLRPIAPVVASAHGYACCSPNTYYFSPGKECTRAHGPGCVPNMLLRGCMHTRDPRSLPANYANTTRRRQGLSAADAVVGYSSATLRHLRRNRLERVHYIRYFAARRPDPPPIPTARRLLFVGRVVKAKGLDVVVRALAKVDAELDVHGDGWALPGVKDLARSLGVLDRIRFHGWSGPDALATAYAEARVVVVPSLWPEPFGMVGTDAMAAARPVVGSATGGIPDWLHHEETGLAVPPGDDRALAAAVDRLLAPDSDAERFGLRGLELVREKFSAAAHLDDVVKTYDAAAAHWAAA
jgi:glycosyltransferase involved in cell wall biosynthesis